MYAESFPYGSVKQKELLVDTTNILPSNYLELVQKPQSEREVEALRNATQRSVPYGKQPWKEKMIDRFKLQASVRARGRPKKGS